MVNLDQLSFDLVQRLPEILDKFEISYKEYKGRLAFPCPIHGGDNDIGCCIYTDGKTSVGNWKCWTHHCEDQFGKNILGFLRGLLSIRNNCDVNYKSAIKWATEIVGAKSGTFDRDRFNFIRLVEEEEEERTDKTREQVRKFLEIPSDFFVNRGFSAQVLDKYDVGLCKVSGHEMFTRVVAPVYNNKLEVVGCVGRSTQPQCDKCGKYHYENRRCPQNRIEQKWAEKWINSAGFSADSYLYNLWYAKEMINRAKIAVLVEGQADVWRLEEAKIKVGLGLFGCELSDGQEKVLHSLDIQHVVLALDSDEAGLEGIKKTEEKLRRYYNITTLKLDKKDIGDYSVDEVRTNVLPVLEKIRCKLVY